MRRQQTRHEGKPSIKIAGAAKLFDMLPAKFFFTLILGSAVISLSGCATDPLASCVAGADYRPSNVYTDEAPLPARLRRVAVLPLTFAGEHAESEYGRDTLEPVLIEEFRRTRQFEVVPISRDQLLRWTGRTAWTGEERLPQDFFEKLYAATDADGVMFCRLTQYHAYEPLAVGWRLRLINMDDLRTVWAADEVFDARQSDVAKSARRFAHCEPAAADSRGILVSPRHFTQYTLCELFKTLPARSPGSPSKKS
jgi:hypothetical protein